MRVDVTDFLRGLNLQVVSETSTELVLYCPFHHNVDTPSFSINKKTGLWQCFNPSCGKSGRFASLTRELKGEDYNVVDESTYEDVLELWKPDAIVEITLDNVIIDYDKPEQVAKIQYLIDRGFTLETLRYFDVGYSEKRKRVVIPVRNSRYKVIGIIGRATSGDAIIRYLYSKGFERKSALFNIQNAMHFPTVIITEGSLDCIRVHQAGYPNVVATLGSKLSPEQSALLNKYFDEIIIFADNDAAGQGLAAAILDGCPRKSIRVVEYPEGLKDPGEMTDKQISNCVDNAIDEIQYIFRMEKL